MMLVLVAFLSFLPFPDHGSETALILPDEGERNIISYSVNNTSWLSISGTTNVNTFECLSFKAVPNNSVIVEATHERNRLSFSNAVILVEIGSFDCKNPLISRDMKRALGGEDNSFIEIKLLEVKPASGNWYTHNRNVIASLVISINGIEKTKEMKIDWQNAGGVEYHFIGKSEISMSDFNIDPPSPAFGMVRVNDTITVSFNYKVRTDLISRID